MSGRAATTNVIPGRYAIAVGDARMPCPPGWVWTILTDVATLESGHTPSREHPEWWGGKIPWVGIKDARRNHGSTILATLENTNAEGLANSAARLLPPGTVCLSRTASVGYVTVMGVPMATSQDFVNWVCSSAVVPDFLKFLLIAENESLHRFSKGTTHSTIYFPEVKAFHVCLPAVNEQKRIVAKIDALQARSSAAQEALDAIPPLLEKFRQSVLVAAFRGDLTKAWREAHPNVEPASELLARIRAERRRRWEEANPRKTYVEPEPVDAEGLPELPEGWCWASVEELCWDGPTNGYSGKTDGRASGTLTMKLSATTQGQLVINDGTTKRLAETIDSDSKFWLKSGDLLVQRANSLPYLGAAAIFEPSAEPMVYPDLMMRLRTIDDITTCLLWRYFNSMACRQWFRSNATGTAGNMPKINGELIRRTAIPVPPSHEAAILVDLLKQAFDGIAAVEGATTSLANRNTELDQSILAKAFRGELVPQDPNDEPASVLLERIRAERALGAGKGASQQRKG